MQRKRIEWDHYFMEIARLVSKRSTCLSRHVGSVAVMNKRIIATGYNGQIIGTKHCEECLRKNFKSGTNLNTCRVVHSEQNVICQAAQYGIKLKESTIYTTLKPCNTCFKLFANCLIGEIIYDEDYPDPTVDDIIKESGYFFSNTDTGYNSIIKIM